MTIYKASFPPKVRASQEVLPEGVGVLLLTQTKKRRRGVTIYEAADHLPVWHCNYSGVPVVCWQPGTRNFAQATLTVHPYKGCNGPTHGFSIKYLL